MVLLGGGEGMEVHVQVRDEGMEAGDDLGEARLPLTEAISFDAAAPSSFSLPLLGPSSGSSSPKVLLAVNYLPPPPSGDGSSLNSFVSEGNSAQDAAKEDKRERMHTGEWVEEIYVAGRLEEWTKYWTCCGCDSHLSMYVCRPRLSDVFLFAGF